MKVSFDIARRYLFGKKSTSAINWITWIVILGMSIGTAAMIITMSVFNGFEGLVSGLFNAYNPDYKVYPVEGLYLDLDQDKLASIKDIKGIEKIARVIQEVAVFEYDGSQEAGSIKGVDESFTSVTDIDSTIVRGNFMLEDESLNYGVLGIGIFNKLSVNPSDALTPITVYMSKRKKRGPLDKDFKTQYLYAKGVFSVGNEDDSQVIIASFDFVNRLLDQKEAVSYLEIKKNNDANETSIREDLTKILGSNINIKNRYQQDEAYLKIMNIEKWVTFLLVALTILILSFNLVGSLWMIVLDKKKDISILRSMGMTSGQVTGIFLRLGVMIGLVGLIIGIIIALILYFLQKQYGLIEVPPGFMIDSYPIELKLSDFIIAIITVLAISMLASILPAFRAKAVSAFVRHE